MRDECQITRNLKAKQGLFFAACEKRGLTIAGLAAALDLSPETLRSYRPTPAREPSQMPLGLFIKLARCEQVPPELLSLLMEDSPYQLSPRDPSQANWLGLGARAATFASKVCAFQATGGTIDHREAAELREDMIVILSEGQGAVTGAG